MHVNNSLLLTTKQHVIERLILMPSELMGASTGNIRQEVDVKRHMKERTREKEGAITNHQVFSWCVLDQASPCWIIRQYFIIIWGSQPKQTWINNLSSQSGGYRAACQSLRCYRSPTAGCISNTSVNLPFTLCSHWRAALLSLSPCTWETEWQHICLWAATTHHSCEESSPPCSCSLSPMSGPHVQL